MFNFFKKRVDTTEDVIDLLERVGFGFSSSSAKQIVTDELGDYRGYNNNFSEVALCIMGDEQFDDDSLKVLSWLSDDVWHFDYEAIEGDGSYVSIVNNCARLTGGDLQISELSDRVSIASDVAVVTFRLDGKKFVYNLRCNSDWADPLIFSLLNSNLKGKGSDKRFFEHNFFGQDCLITCKSPSEVEKINRATGLRFGAPKG